MTCTKCQKPIEKGQPYHRSKKGPHHRDCMSLAAPVGSAAGCNAQNIQYQYQQIAELCREQTAIMEDACLLAATVVVNLDRGTLKDDEHGTLRILAKRVLAPKQQNDQAHRQPPGGDGGQQGNHE